MSRPNTQNPLGGRPIPTPVDFPVTWSQPDEAELLWRLEGHHTDPMTPLVYEVAAAFFQGGSPAFDQIGLPFHARFKRINTYAYMGMASTAEPPQAVIKMIGAANRVAPGMIKRLMGKMMANMSKQQLEKITPIAEHFDQHWSETLLPEIKQHLAYLESSDLRGLSPEQLHALFSESLKRVERIGALHMLAIFPGFFAMSQFAELYCELFGGATTLDALRLLQGFTNKVLEGNRALWELSRTALNTPAVCQVLAECPTENVMAALEKSAECERFLGDLHAYLEQYGRRLNSIFALAEPGWIEDPRVVVENLKAYITQTAARPEGEQASMAAEREKAVVEARAKIARYPRPVVAQFETLLKAAQTAAVVHEEHNYWIDQRLFYQVRLIIVEIGRRLAEAGALESADDVFYLSQDDLKNRDGAGWMQKVRQCKAEMERFSHIKPPEMLGTMPAFDRTDAGPLVRAIAKSEKPSFGAEGAQANGVGRARMVKGEAGSSGVARGIARVIHSLAEAGKLQKGDVLVAVATLPPWTPLFATAAAIVTDEGGVLSHSAVVAREYHIPAVVGTGHATSAFQDGQLLEVDGYGGTVRVIVEEADCEPALAG